METDSSSTNDDANTQRMLSAKKDTTAEKKKLLREIQELKCIIKQCELHVNTVCFEDIEEHTTKLQIPRTLRDERRLKRIPNIEVDLQNELYNFAGFNCVKFHRDEIVFNFMTTNALQENNTYAVQIFIKDGKGSLGKWVMPMSIDMSDILIKTPIDKLQNLSAFLKNCRCHIDCYVVRQEQYLKLKKHISDMKHCKLQSNIGYTQINLELYGINDIKKDECLNLIIYIMYHSDEARPYKIDIDTVNQDKLSSDAKQRLKVYLKPFKTLDLTTAFDQILTDDNSEFILMETDDSDSLLELNDISNSDAEGFVGEFFSNRKKSLANAKRKRELQKKWKKIKRQRDTSSFTTSRNITSFEDNIDIEDNRSKANVRKRKLTRKKRVKEVAFTPNLKETTPFKQPGARLRQKKLNFQTVQDTSSGSANKNSLATLKLRNKPSSMSRVTKLVTSTPLVRKIISTRSSSSSLNIENISNIGRPEENSDKLKMIPRTVPKKSDPKNSSLSTNKSTPTKKSARLSQKMN